METVSIKVVNVFHQNAWYRNSVGRIFSNVKISVAQQDHMCFKKGDLVYKLEPGIFTNYSSVYIMAEDAEIVDHVNSDSEQFHLFERIFQN